MFSTLITPYLNDKILFPIYHFCKGDGLCKIIKAYKKSQWLSYEQLCLIQKKKLINLLTYCKYNVPYYQNLIKEKRLWNEDLSEYHNFKKLPYLTKDIINKNKDSIVANSVKKRDLVVNSTSGSTGENLQFFQDKRCMLARQAVVWRNQKWVNCFYADKQATLWGAPFDLKTSESIKGKLHALFTRDISLSSYELSEQSMEKYENILNKYKPRLLVSYPSPLNTFAEFLLANKKTIPSIKSIITSAETLYKWQRSTIETAFDCPVFDRYGCREFGNIAHECDRHEGYHVNIERFFLETLNDRGKPVKDGESGEIVITDLDNYGFPFIRYKISDIAVPSSDSCSCGRGLPMLKSIEGRTFDVIKAPNGNKIAGTFWTLALRAYPGIKNFQVEQILINKITLRIVTDDDYSRQTEKKIIRLIQDKCGREMEINIIYVDRIPLTKSGKRKFVLSRLTANQT